MSRNKEIAKLTRSKLLSEYDFTDLLEKKIVIPDVNADQPFTVREYFLILLTKLWIEGEGFSSKRPFGNSGWDLDLEVALIEAGVMPGTVERDEDGYVQDHEAHVDTHEFVRLLIANL